MEFARTPLSSRPRRDSGESHYAPGKNSTTARLRLNEALGHYNYGGVIEWTCLLGLTNRSGCGSR